MTLTTFFKAAALACSLGLALPVPAQTAAKPKATKAAKAAAAKPAPKAAAKPAAPPPLEPASAEQREAAALVFLGRYECELNQQIDVSASTRGEAYIDVRLGKQLWTMKPVLSSTGARRLEDVGGRMLVVQIAYKSMLLDVKSGQRVADECVHEEQRAAKARDVAAGVVPMSLLGGGAAAAPSTLRLRILETSDIHMNLVGYDYYQDKPVQEYGLDRIATLIAAARSEARNTLLFDNGDLIQGSPLGDTVARLPPPAGQMHPAHRVMKQLGFDAGNIGNHEFNYGLQFLLLTLAGAPFPYVNANLMQDDGRGTPAAQAKNVFKPWVILPREFTDDAGNKQMLKVGVIGFAPPQVLQWDRQNLDGRLLARDIPETARQLVPQMKAAGADIVVVIAHSGFERTETTAYGAENTVARLAEVPGVSAILFGHSHGEFPGSFFAQHPKVNLRLGTINGVAATMPGFWGSHLGVIDLTLDKTADGWKVSDGRAALRPVYDRTARKSLAAPDPQVMALIKPEHEATLAAMRSEVARTTAPIDSYFAQVTDDASVQLVANAQLAYAKKALAGTAYAGLPLLSAAAPFKTGGRGGTGYYTDIPAGALALRNVADLYVYPNTVNVVRVTGAQLREWLEYSAGAFNRIDPAGAREQELLNPAFPSYDFDVIDGVSYRIDVTQPARYERGGKLVAPGARRIVELRFDGRPLDDAAQFAVVTNNYRASGGGNDPGLDGSSIVLAAPDENRQALVQYLKDAKTLNPAADGNWRIQPVPGVALRFTSGAAGAAHLARYPQIRRIRDNGDGSALYELAPAP